MSRRLHLVLFATCLGAAAPALARDYGQQGALFQVIEADLLSVIQKRLTAMQASGEIDRANRQLAERTAAQVRRPVPTATEYRPELDTTQVVRVA